MVRKGDDLGAFNYGKITVELEDFDIDPNIVITRAVFQCGCIRRDIKNPIFPLEITLSGKETRTLNDKNTGYLAVWDDYEEDGVLKPRKTTCEGYVIIEAEEEVVYG